MNQFHSDLKYFWYEGKSTFHVEVDLTTKKSLIDLGKEISVEFEQQCIYFSCQLQSDSKTVCWFLDLSNKIDISKCKYSFDKNNFLLKLTLFPEVKNSKWSRLGSSNDHYEVLKEDKAPNKKKDIDYTSLVPIKECQLGIEYVWTQSEQIVELTFEVEKLQLRKKPIVDTISPRLLELEFQIGSKSKILEFILSNKIQTKSSKFSITEEGNLFIVKISLMKETVDSKYPFWQTLTEPIVKAKNSTLPSVYSKNKVNFDNIAKEVEYCDKNMIGEEGNTSKFYQNVYKDCDENGQKTAIKSMQQSGGRVLDFSGADKDFSKVED